MKQCSSRSKVPRGPIRSGRESLTPSKARCRMSWHVHSSSQSLWLQMAPRQSFLMKMSQHLRASGTQWEHRYRNRKTWVLVLIPSCDFREISLFISVSLFVKWKVKERWVGVTDLMASTCLTMPSLRQFSCSLPHHYYVLIWCTSAWSPLPVRLINTVFCLIASCSKQWSLICIEKSE